MDIGTKIRKIRETKGYTQEYMAMNLSISQSKYCNIESSKSNVDFELLLKIATLLQTDLQEFVPENYNFFNIQNNHDNAVSGWIINEKDIAKEQIILQQLKDKEKIIALQEDKIAYLIQEVADLKAK